MIKTRRLYEPGGKEEGYRIFVDRLWPRGISKEKAGWDEWLKEIAPGDDLRKWYHKDPSRWEEFKSLYRKELHKMPEALKRIRQLELEHGTVTFLYSSTEKEHNNAMALKEILNEYFNYSL